MAAIGTFSGSYNGLTFGVGTQFVPTSYKGLQDMPPIRSADESSSGDHGWFAGIDYLDERTVELGLTIQGLGLVDLDSQCDLLEGAFAVQPVEQPLTYYLADTTVGRVINCRARRVLIPRDLKRSSIYVNATIELVATDPRKYALTPTIVPTGLASSSGGMMFPATFPLGFGSVGAGGIITLTNAGNFQTPLQFTISGPVTNPIIDNVTTGQSLQFNIILASTDTLVIAGAGTIACSILLNPGPGQASRRNALLALSAPLAQFGLPGGSSGPCTPGVTQQFRYRNNGPLTGSTLTVQFPSAWI